MSNRRWKTKNTLDALGGTARSITITHEAEHIFVADLVVERTDGTEVHLDCRPSDALALAARCDPRPEILVPAHLLAPTPR